MPQRGSRRPGRAPDSGSGGPGLPPSPTASCPSLSRSRESAALAGSRTSLLRSPMGSRAHAFDFPTGPGDPGAPLATPTLPRATVTAVPGLDVNGVAALAAEHSLRTEMPAPPTPPLAPPPGMSLRLQVAPPPPPPSPSTTPSRRDAMRAPSSVKRGPVRIGLWPSSYRPKLFLPLTLSGWASGGGAGSRGPESPAQARPVAGLGVPVSASHRAALKTPKQADSCPSPSLAAVAGARPTVQTSRLGPGEPGAFPRSRRARDTRSPPGPGPLGVPHLFLPWASWEMAALDGTGAHRGPGLRCDS